MPAESSRRVRVLVSGVVQGVGFRPFVFRKARRLGLGGSVRNTTAGVEIEAEGPSGRIERFLEAIGAGPPMAHVERVDVSDLAPRGERKFRVEESAQAREGASLVSPDLATCPTCLRELGTREDRRHRYAFVNCTDCGPRFTIIDSLPYDRERTTMRGFPLCPACHGEYADPHDRRYHAEATACATCGPRVRLVAPDGAPVAEGDDAVVEARRLLGSGGIVAIKGMGGYHLACDATCGKAVERLRALKGRPDRPLAVMCRDLSVAGAYCRISAAEARHLASMRRPILLLASRPEPERGYAAVADAVAPAHDVLGVMLPYTPLHHLILEPGGPACLVMTSGNLSEEPIVIDDAEAVRKLGPLSDAVVLNDREILNRCDDSVGFVLGGRLSLIRRARGFVPLPVDLGIEVRPTLALGAMLSNTFAMAIGRRAFFSQHIGDVDSQAAVDFMRESIGKFRRWLELDPEIVASDMHPDLLTTHLADEFAVGRRRVSVQHHHAHLVSAMVAASIDGDAQGLVCDGTGWGPDGTIWGGELLVGSASGYRRLGHLRPLPLPGGEASIRKPSRLAAAYLHVLVPSAEGMDLDLWRRLGPDETSLVRRMVDRGFNCPLTSSMGRLFDAVSSLLGVRDDATYEGQAAIELEQVAIGGRASRGPDLRIDVVDDNGNVVLDPSRLLSSIVDAMAGRAPIRDVAAGFHGAVAVSLAEACSIVRDRGGPSTVVLAGGVFQNRILLRLTSRALESSGLVPVLPALVPAGDGGLALGQIAVANAVVSSGPTDYKIA